MTARLPDLFAGVDADLRQVFARNPLPMWLYDTQTLHMLAANPAALKSYGYSEEDFIALSLPDLYPEDELERLHESLRLPLIERVAQRAWRHRRRNGELMQVEIVTQELQLGEVAARMVMVSDRTERLRLDAEFQRSREQLSELTQRLMTQERSLVRGMAQTLHDHLGQTMAAIRMTHETVLTLQSSLPSAVSPEVARLQGHIGVLIGQAIKQIRQVLAELRPPLLEEQGFAAAIENELRNLALSRPQVDMVLNVAPASTQIRWPPDVEYAAFMVAREAIENALRHSGSPSITVHLSGSAKSLQLEVVDDGSGIVEVTPEGQVRHLGILGMHERAQVIGARVSVTSAPGMGTQVRFSWSSSP